MSKSSPKKKKRVLTPYEQRMHNNWLRHQKLQERRERESKNKKSKSTKAEPKKTPPPAALTKEQVKLHWQDQAALDEQHRRQALMAERRRELKRVKLQQRQQIDDWLKSNDQQVNVQELATAWEGMSREFRDKILQVAVRYFAIADAGTQVNNVLRYGMKMEDASLDMKEFVGTLVRHMRVDLNRLLLDQSELSAGHKDELISRVIAKEFPTRDNRVSLPKRGAAPINPQRVLQDALKREVKKYEPGS